MNKNIEIVEREFNFFIKRENNTQIILTFKKRSFVDFILSKVVYVSFNICNLLSLLKLTLKTNFHDI